jgi:hypothetical protein
MNGPTGVDVNSVVSNNVLRDFNVEMSGAGACVMLPSNLPAVRTMAGASSPESVPTANIVNTGNAKLNKGGAFIGFFPNTQKRLFKMTFTSSSEYSLEYKEDGAMTWTLDRIGANIANDEIFTSAFCFVFKNWWDLSSGSPVVGDIFEFSADPACTTIEMPVIFRDDSGEAINLTNNHVNCVVNANNVLTAQSFGPQIDYNGSGIHSILGDYVDAMFRRSGYTTVLTADDRSAYSNYSGSLHCGSNVERTIPVFKWWEK